MRTRFVEVSQDQEAGFNWGKFMLAEFDVDEWSYHSVVDPAHRLVNSQGWGPGHILVLDLATGEGALFLPGGYAPADLNKHQVWVCPMFEPFLGHLYEFVKDGNDPFDLPPMVELPNAPAAMSGYRRTGSEES